jgi:transcriptional regulator with XRE-family HTH domain
MTSMKTLGDRLRARRRDLDMTIAEVAEAAQLSLPYVSNLERGRGNPTLDALRALAAALEMPIADLLDEGEEQEVLVSIALASAPPSLARFARKDAFDAVAKRLAAAQQIDTEEMRRRLLFGMANAPRRSTGEPNEEDWRRLLDAYRLILEQEE